MSESEPSDTAGTLFVVPTPIGNLEDVTLRAIRVLKTVDLIAAEDTRHSRRLLDHYGITTHVVSYHQHSRAAAGERILKTLESGSVALISDAGMPALSDPGVELIRTTIDAGFEVDVLPGPSAITTAVTLAAIPAAGYLFLGFLPRTKSDMTERLSRAGRLPYCLVIFESPNRVMATLKTVRETLGDRTMVATKELTKLHQTTHRGSISDVLAQLEGETLRGEWTLVLGPGASEDTGPSELEIVDVLTRLTDAGETPRDAVRIAAAMLDLPRSTVYRAWLSKE